MSTKIYEAYRLVHGANLWDTVRRIHARAVKNVKGELIKLYEEIIADANTPEKRAEVLTVARRSQPDDIPDRLTPMTASDFVRRMYGAQLNSPSRNKFALDVSIAFRSYEDRVYIIPYPGDTLRSTLKFLKRDPALENFAYWNNVDKPKNVSQKQWDYRGKIWSELDASWQTMLILEIMSYTGFSYIDPVWDASYIKAWKKKHGASKVSSPPA